MKILLLFPPAWTPTMPHLATPMLTAYLRQQGVEVIQRDLNAEMMDRVLSAEHLEGTLRTLHKMRRAGETTRKRPSGIRPPGKALEWAFSQGPALVREVEQAKKVMRSEAFYDGRASRRAFEVIVASLQLVSLPFYPASLDLSTYTSTEPEENSARLLGQVRDPARNLFYRLMEREFIPSLLNVEADVVGISIPTMGQFLAGLTVAYLLRKHGYTGHITVGGPHITMLREQLMTTPSLFEIFDSAVIFGGEGPLLRLAQVLEGHEPLEDVPNLIFRKGGEIKATERLPDLPLSQLPTPDFAGLDLGLYLVPEPVLPLITARGCYYGRCAFCNVGYGEQGHFEEREADLVVRDMLALSARYGARHVFFADEAITPRNLRGISERLAALGAPVHWTTCARMERALTKDLLERLASGGCRMLLYGLESGSERIVAAMHKGIRVEEMGRVLRESAAAGIWNHVFFFFGFPGETMDDAQETVNFIYAHADSIHSAALGTFLLERYAPAHRDPERYGIIEVGGKAAADLAIYFDYRVGGGIDEALAETIVERLMDALPGKEYPQFYVHDTYRFLYASRLHDLGERYPTWLGG